MKIITIETLKTFLDELNKKYGTEFYSRKEIDDKLKELSKTSGYTQEKADAMMQEIARRVPNYQYEVKITQKPHQTITATVNGQTYTSDFYAPQGSAVTFSVSAAGGYNAGTLSLEYVTLKEDTVVTVTEATEIPASASGTKTFGADLPTGYEEFRVPPNVQVLKFTWDRKELYVKVKPQSYIGITINKVDNKYEVKDDPYVYLYDGEVPDFIEDGDERYTELYAFNIFYGQSSEPLTVSWSTEINNHSTTEDWTQPK